VTNMKMRRIYYTYCAIYSAPTSLMSSQRVSALHHSREFSVLRAFSNKHYENYLVLPPVSQQAVCVMAVLIAFFYRFNEIFD
jgi:hypothetical protein